MTLEDKTRLDNRLPMLSKQYVFVWLLAIHEKHKILENVEFKDNSSSTVYNFCKKNDHISSSSLLRKSSYASSTSKFMVSKENKN